MPGGHAGRKIAWQAGRHSYARGSDTSRRHVSTPLASAASCVPHMHMTCIFTHHAVAHMQGRKAYSSVRLILRPRATCFLVLREAAHVVYVGVGTEVVGKIGRVRRRAVKR